MKKSTQTKERILKSAMEIVAQKGYSASSTREIAEMAGVSEATIFKYYGTKDELLKTMVMQTMDEFYNFSVQEAIPQVFERSKNHSIQFLIREFIKERLEFVRQNSHVFKIILQEMLINETVYNMFKEKIWSKMVEVTNHIFDQGKATGEIRDMDNHYLRKAFLGIGLFSTVVESLLQSDQPEDHQEEQLDMILEILFHGIKEE